MQQLQPRLAEKRRWKDNTTERMLNEQCHNAKENRVNHRKAQFACYLGRNKFTLRTIEFVDTNRREQDRRRNTVPKKFDCGKSDSTYHSELQSVLERSLVFVSTSMRGMILQR